MISGDGGPHTGRPRPEPWFSASRPPTTPHAAASACRGRNASMMGRVPAPLRPGGSRGASQDQPGHWATGAGSRCGLTGSPTGPREVRLTGSRGAGREGGLTAVLRPGPARGAASPQSDRGRPRGAGSPQSDRGAGATSGLTQVRAASQRSDPAHGGPYNMASPASRGPRRMKAVGVE